MRFNYSNVSDKYRWGVSQPCDNKEEIILALESDAVGSLFCRVRLTAEDARDIASQLLHLAQDIEKK